MRVSFQMTNAKLKGEYPMWFAPRKRSTLLAGHLSKSLSVWLATSVLLVSVSRPSTADPLGATPHNDGTTTFRVWAPFVDAVAVKINGGTPVPLAKEAGHSDAADTTWAGTVPGARAGDKYRYAMERSGVTLEGCVRDRASRLVLAGHHGYDPCVVWGERDAVPGMRINSRQGTTGAHGAGLPPVSLPVWQAVQRAQHRLVEPDAISE